jgi:hypothetical protein
MQKMRSSPFFGPAVAAAAWITFGCVIAASTGCTKQKPPIVEMQKAKPAPDRTANEYEKQGVVRGSRPVLVEM